MPSVIEQRRTVNVSRFSVYDIQTDEFQPSRRWATKEFIDRIGARSDGASVRVDEDFVDAEGLTERDINLAAHRNDFQTEVGA